MPASCPPPPRPARATAPRLAACWLGLFAAPVALAQDRPVEVPPALELDAVPAEVRPVSELRLRAVIDASRDLRSAADPAAVVPLLARAGVDASLHHDYSARVLLGAAGALGRPTEPAVFVDEAWLDARAALLGGLGRLRLGRQALDLHGGRLLSSDAFLDTSRRVDALRATAAVGEFEIEALVAFLSTWLAAGLPAREVARDDLLGGVLASYQLGAGLGLRAHALSQLGGAIGNQDDPAFTGDERAPLRVATLGLEVQLQPHQLLAAATALSVQLGEARALEQQAFDLSLALRLRAPWPGHPTLCLGYDQASGDRQPFDLRHNTFVNPLGARHDRFGAADLLAPRNAQDLHAALRVDEGASWAALSLHRLALDSTREAWLDVAGSQRLAAPGGDERLLGHELDLQGSLAAHPQLGLELLYAVFLPDGIARQAVGPRAGHRLLVGVRASF